MSLKSVPLQDANKCARGPNPYFLILPKETDISTGSSSKHPFLLLRFHSIIMKLIPQGKCNVREREKKQVKDHISDLVCVVWIYSGKSFTVYEIHNPHFVNGIYQYLMNQVVVDLDRIFEYSQYLKHHTHIFQTVLD